MAAIQRFAGRTFRHTIIIAARFFALLTVRATFVTTGNFAARACRNAFAVLAFLVGITANFILDTPKFAFACRTQIGFANTLGIANFPFVTTIVAALDLPVQAYSGVRVAFAFAVVACLPFCTAGVAAFELQAVAFGYTAHIRWRACNAVFLYAIAVRIFICARHATAVGRFLAARFAHRLFVAVFVDFTTAVIARAKRVIAFITVH